MDETRPRSLPARLVAVGLGSLKPRLLIEVAAGVGQALGVAWRPGPPLDRPGYAYNEVRGQYHAPAILRRLAPLRGAAGGAVLGLVDGDLFLPEDGEYVLGDVDRGEGAGLVGLRRLGAADPAALRKRALIEALHVMGRLMGLSTCLDYRCAMFPARDVTDVDRKGEGYCAHCRTALRLPQG